MPSIRRSTDSVVDVGIVGAGHIARRHVAAMNALARPPCRVIGIADVDPARASALAGIVGAPSFASAAALLGGRKPDLVIVATPPSRHADDVVCCLEQGVHVLCEKPFVTSAEDLQRVLEVHSRHDGVVLRMASQYRYAAGVGRALSLVQDGAIGAVLSVHVVFAHPVDMAGRWYADPGISGGGVLMDNGSHALDLMRLILGPLAGVWATADESTGLLPVEDVVTVHAWTASGQAGRADLSWVTAASTPFFLRIQGTEGAIGVGWREVVLECGGHADSEVVGPAHDGLAAMGNQLIAMCNSVTCAEPVGEGVADAVANVDALIAAYGSLVTGCRQPLGGDGKAAEAGVRVLFHA